MTSPSPESQMVAAYRAGQATVDQVDPTCPHDGNSDDPRERVLARMWRKGRLAAIGEPPPLPE